MQRLLTKREVADLLQVSPQTIDKLRAAGELRALRVRGRVRFDQSDIDAYLKAQQMNGGRR